MSKALQNAFKDFIASNGKDDPNNEEGAEDQNDKNLIVTDTKIPESPGLPLSAEIDT